MSKQITQRNFEEMVDFGAYLGGQGCLQASNPFPSDIVASSALRGVRGHIDKYFMVNKPCSRDDNAGENQDVPLPTNPNDARNAICMNIGRCFFNNAILLIVIRNPSLSEYVAPWVLWLKFETSNYA